MTHRPTTLSDTKPKPRGMNGGRPLTGPKPLTKAMIVWMEPEMQEFVLRQGGSKWIRSLLHQAQMDCRNI